MAQDPDREDEIGLPSHALDMVTLWSSSATNAEMEAENIRGVLESNDIPAMIVGANQYPVLGYEVRVPRGKVVEAEEFLAQAQEGGPEAAEAAEAETEKQQ
jgi:Putative prokaryotic signal transducing protein